MSFSLQYTTTHSTTTWQPQPQLDGRWPRMYGTRRITVMSNFSPAGINGVSSCHCSSSGEYSTLRTLAAKASATPPASLGTLSLDSPSGVCSHHHHHKFTAKVWCLRPPSNRKIKAREPSFFTCVGKTWQTRAIRQRASLRFDLESTRNRAASGHDFLTMPE